MSARGATNLLYWTGLWSAIAALTIYLIGDELLPDARWIATFGWMLAALATAALAIAGVWEALVERNAVRKE